MTQCRMCKREQRRHFSRQWVPAALAILAFPVSHAWGQEPETVDYSNVDVKALIDELRRAQEDIRSLQSEVSQLKAAEGEKWLTEERAREIRALVSDVLIDADSRASLRQEGLTAGWDENFFLASPDGRFLLEIDGQIQFRYVYSWHQDEAQDDHRAGYELTRTHLTFRGHVINPDLTYLVRTDVTRDERGLVTGIFFLQDAWIRYQLNNDWSLRFGQFKMPFNREELVYSGYQLLVERSLVNEGLNIGRSQGIELAFAGKDFRFTAMTSDTGEDNVTGGGIVSPGGRPKNSSSVTTRDTEYAVTGRLEWKAAGTWEQFEDFTSPMDDPFGLLIGAAAHWQEGEHGDLDFEQDEDDWFGYTLDTSVEWGGANLFASFTHHIIDSPDLATTGGIVDAFGAVVQGGIYLTPEWEVFMRYEWGRVETDAQNLVRTRRDGTPVFDGIAFNTLNVVTAGFNYYFHEHAAKWTTDIGVGITGVDISWDSDIAGWRTDAEPEEHQIVFRTQFQLLF